MADFQQCHIVDFQALQGIGRQLPIRQQSLLQNAFPERIGVVERKLKKVLGAKIQRPRGLPIFQSNDLQEPVVVRQVPAQLLTVESLGNALAMVLRKSETVGFPDEGKVLCQPAGFATAGHRAGEWIDPAG